jgi:hypothetical protein
MRKSMYPILILVILGGRALAQDRTSALATAPQCSLTTFDVPGSEFTAPVSINEDGAITGAWLEPHSGLFSRGFLREKDGTIITFDVPGSSVYISTGPSSINGSGAITGTVDDGTTQHGFLRSKKGTFTVFDVPGSIATAASSINGAGEIMGIFVDSNGVHGFLRSKQGTFTTIDPGYSAYGESINGAGRSREPPFPNPV